MSVLLLRLAGSMQSWGTDSRFNIRETGREPSKSGVIGLVCAAMGRLRDEAVDDLASLRMGVRVDFEGVVLEDFQTARNVLRASGGEKPVEISHRYYLADADFLVALEGDKVLLSQADAALRDPVFQIFLGRKAFPPTVQPWIPNGLLADSSLEDSLKHYPWPRIGRAIPDAKHRPDKLRAVLEVGPGVSYESRTDQPTGCAFRDRTFADRFLITELYKLGQTVPIREVDHVFV
jgi:CRISPR system Cascade subunit CasD